MRDTYEFIGEQYLGHWNKNGLGINLYGGLMNKVNWEWKLPGWNPDLGIMAAFGNSDFREYRKEYHQGGDLLLFSDIQKISVDEKIEISD